MPNKLQIRKGMTVKEYAKSNMCKCKNCGAHIKIEEYETQWYK